MLTFEHDHIWSDPCVGPFFVQAVSLLTGGREAVWSVRHCCFLSVNCVMGANDTKHCSPSIFLFLFFLEALRLINRMII